MRGTHQVACTNDNGCSDGYWALDIIATRDEAVFVVPRSGRLGEHVDDHQERFARWMAGRGQVLVATEEAELHWLLDRVLDDPKTYRRPGRLTDVAHVAKTFGELIDGLMGAR